MKTQLNAPVQNKSEDMGANVTDASPESIAAAAKAASDAKEKARQEVIESLTFAELFDAIKNVARWSDVLEAATEFGGYCHEGRSKQGVADKPAAIARKAAGIAPSKALALRLSLASYGLSGRTANKTQLAELSSKLPLLETKADYADKGVKFGGIVLPPIVGELS